MRAQTVETPQREATASTFTQRQKTLAQQVYDDLHAGFIRELRKSCYGFDNPDPRPWNEQYFKK